MAAEVCILTTFRLSEVSGWFRFPPNSDLRFGGDGYCSISTNWLKAEGMEGKAFLRQVC